MRAYILVIFFFLLTFQTFSQNEMETSCIKKIKEFSANINFPKFIGKTVIAKDSIKFDSSIIIVWDTKPELIEIFRKGLLFPDLIFGASTRGDKYEIKSFGGADTLSISNVKELNFQNQRPHTKSFSFLLWNTRMANPSLYLFELTNDNSIANADLRTFISNAKVTAFGFCSILI